MAIMDIYGIVALLMVLGTVMVWFQKVKAVRVPKVRFHFFALTVLGAVLGIYTLTGDATLIGKIPAGKAIAFGFIFPAFRLGSAQGVHKPVIEVGEPIIDFTALDDKGNEFDLASLRGTPFLLKFFRGHW